ncbi:TRAF-like family protein [Hirschfeldia incana]|nr:TRAF-like family protein [Hirschfeldia incana]
MSTGSEVVSTIVKKWREHPPSSYCLKVDNFKQLEKFTASSDDKYESRLFSSGGYNWKLIVYPKGNRKDNGKGFISMYVEIDSKSFISEPQCEVFAELIFFVYNKKENKYFTIQDVEVKRFNALKTVWGLRQVLPFDSFNNPENGYVFEEDQCEFGVDVVVPSPLTSWEILSFNKKLQKPKFSWTVKKFSQLKEHEYTSNKFSVGERNWVLKLYPKGYSREGDKWLSVFLHLADNGAPKADEKIFVQANLRVLDPHGSNHKAYQMNTWQIGKNLGWGWDEFLSLDELRKAYLDKEDALNVEAEFEVVSATKYSPII